MNKIDAPFDWKTDYSRQYYAENKEAIKKQKLEYRAKNLEKINKQNREYQRVRRLECKEVIKKQSQKSYYKNKYGITPVEKDAMLAQQNYSCAVCRTVSSGGNHGWHTDHDHVTGMIRGILCRSCNLVLGHVKDDADRLQKLIDYLQR